VKNLRDIKLLVLGGRNIFRFFIGYVTDMLMPEVCPASEESRLAWNALGEMEKAKEDWKRAKEIEPGLKVPE
jgi:hypothetical protein